VAGSYCSTECAARAKGESFLSDLRDDHRFCWSCLRQRKEIERPTDEARRGKGRYTAEAMIGFEYATEHADAGAFGLECRCGAVDNDTPAYNQRESAPYYWLLVQISRMFVAEGQREDTIDLPTLADVHFGTDDLALAVGRGLLADSR
jgi:hypothetical protein